MGLSEANYRIDCDWLGCDYYMEYADDMLLVSFWMAEGGAVRVSPARYLCKTHTKEFP